MFFSGTSAVMMTICLDKVWEQCECLVSETLLALLENVVTESLTTRQGNHTLVILSRKHEDIGNTSGESTTLGILHMHNLEGANVLLATSDDTNTALILSTGDHTGSTSLELNDILGLASLDVHFDDIVELGKRIRVADGAAIVGDDVWDTLGTNSDRLHTSKLVRVLVGEGLAVQAVQNETALGIVHHAEVLVGLVNGDNVHEATRVVGVGANLAIDLDEALHENLLDLLLGESVFETVTQDQDQWQAFTHLVRAGGWTRCPRATHLG